MTLGLTEMDAKVYIFLSKKGLQKALDISKSLKMNKEQLYRSLKKMQTKGIVTATLEHPARFSAVPFKKILDLFIRAKMDEAQELEQNKDEILSVFQSIAVGETDSSAKFTVFEGRNIIYSRIQQMIQETKKHFSTITTVSGLLRANQFGLFDVGLNQFSKSKVQFRFLTEISQKNARAMQTFLDRMKKTKLNFEGRSPDLGLKLFPRLVLRDEEEAMFFISPNQDTSATEQDDVCLWTNSKALVQAFIGVFEDLWHNSMDVEKKLFEIETGKSIPKTCVIRDADAAFKKYFDTSYSAKHEILMMTSAQGLLKTWENMPLLKELSEKGVKVKIMAPITGDILKTSQQLMEFCEVRYVPTSYLRTTIVDGQHLFQFKNPPMDEKNLENAFSFNDTFYTNDYEYVEKTKNMLDEIWGNSRSPSAITLDLIIQASTLPGDNAEKGKISGSMLEKVSAFTYIDGEEPSRRITEKDVLHKVMNTVKLPAEISLKNVMRGYMTTGQAIIHPPASFKLPDIMIHVFHYEKQSTFGEEDAMIIYLWLKTPSGFTYVPVAIVEDNSSSVTGYKAWFAGSPAAENVQLVKKDEIQVRMHGNNLFAGWTVPIPLISTYQLPPGSMLFEGNGNLKTGAFTLVLPSGFKSKFEYNGFEAFVTFFHPSAKYSGPATDGFLGRDVVAETTPP